MKKILAVVLSAQIVTQAALGQVTHLETPGNLKATMPVTCIALEQAHPHLSPADLHSGVWDCYKKKDYIRASELVMLLYARGVFDTCRVIDKTAHQAMIVLMMDLASKDPEGWKENMSPVIASYADQQANYAKLCATLHAMPPPAHSAKYMIQHGMGAITGSSADPLMSDFDADRAWAEVLSDFMKCE